MNEMQRIWREKSDEDLLEAAANLDEYTEEGRRVIEEELERRRLEPPGPDEGDEEGSYMEEEGAEEEGALTCLRCDVELKYLGTKSFHEGRHWGVLGELGHLFESTENFDVYVCPGCGHIDLFARMAARGEADEEPRG